MPSERGRHQLYEQAKEAMSVDAADELMSYLPPVGWADVATKSDLAMIRLEMDAMRAELRAEISELRAEISDLRSDLKSDMSDLKSDLQRWTITTVIAMTGLFGAIVFGVASITR